MEIKDLYVAWYASQGQRIQIYNSIKVQDVLYDGSWADIPDNMLEYSIDKWYIDFEEQAIVIYAIPTDSEVFYD